jgi:dipeptidyl aminopeptidase/acylaminoacyl peptidase
VVTWKSTDGWTVEGVLLKPVGYQPGRRYPLKVDVHGGPTGAHVNGFKANWGSPGQFYAGQGWAVLYPNPRGSTGYGEKFMRGNIKDWGGGDYRDIMTGVDELVRRGIADSTRLAVSGWSYGGYMTGWVVSQTQRFKAAMMGAGLSNMESMYGTTDIPGYIGTFYDGMPQLDGTLSNKSLEFYRSRSAIQYSDKVTTPLLMLHGSNDERVPIGQPMEYYRNLKDRGKTVELVFYPREGHGLGEYYHQIDKIRREHEWIVKHTLGNRVVQ